MTIRILIFLCLALAFTGCKPSTGKGKKLVGKLKKDQVVAIVNGEEVLAGPVEEILKTRMLAYQRQTGKPFPAHKIEQARRQLIEQLISETVIMQAVQNSKIKVSDEQIQERLDNAVEMLGGKDKFENYLRQTNYTFDKFKKDIEADIKATILMEQQMGAPTATLAEAKEFFDEHKEEFVLPESVDASHILIKVAADAPISTQKMVKAKLREIRKDILAGKISFEEAAKKYSECPTAKDGGKIGAIFKNDQSVSLPFADAAFALDISNISDVVESEFGDHLIFITQKSAVKTADFDEVEYKLMDFLTDKKKRELAEEWTIDLRSKADVKYK